MTQKRILSILIFVFLLTGGASAIPQPSTAHIKVLTMNEGLPDNSVNDLAEDKYGFIWIATWNGLARYDGKYVTTYRHHENMEGSLSNNMVRSIKPDDSGLWVGSDAGLDFFRYLDCSFHPAYYVTDGNDSENLLNKRVSRILKHGEDIFVINGNGELLRLDYTDSENGDFRPVFRTLPKPANRNYADVSGFCDDRLLVLSNDGIIILSGNGEQELYHNALTYNYDPNLNLFFDSRQMTVTIGGGIGSETQEFFIDRNGKMSVSQHSEPYSNLMSMTQDGNNIYYGTDGNGLFINDGEKIIQFLPDNSSLPCDAIYKVFTDSNHNVWIGSYRHGVFMLSHNLNSYSIMDKHSGMLCYDIVTAVIPDGDTMYLGLDGGGLEILDTKTGKYRQFNKKNSQLPADNVVSIVKEGNTLWAAVYGTGLVECDPSTGRFQTYKADKQFEPGNKLWVIADGGDNNLWVGGNSLSVFNKHTHEFTVIEGTEKSDVLSMAIDDNNVIVSTRWSGILQVDRRNLALAERHGNSPTKGGIRLPGRRIPFVFVDSRHNLWADIDNTMLCKIDLEKKAVIKTYRHRSGETGVQVLSMAEDPNGNLLIGTNRGLLRYVREKDVIMPLNDERMPRMFTFNASAKDATTAYFGTTSGLLCYPFEQHRGNKKIYSPIFTGLEVFSNGGTSIPLFSKGDSIIELDNSQNYFKVNFTVPEMSNPEQMKFECKLEGFDDGWRDVTETRSATYTYVPTGTYHLQIRHTMPDGSWSEICTLDIKVSPPWYASTIFIFIWILLSIVIVALIWLFWRKYDKNREKTALAELERDSANRLNEAKLDFYANITHELRTPCFLISAQIEEMYDSGRQSIPVNNLGGIYRNSAKLNKLISHIIDFRKTDTGHLALNARHIDLTALLGELSEDYVQLCRQKSLTFNFIHSGGTPVIAEVDPDKVELIVTNLISNAYKYTPKGGYVNLELNDTDEMVEIRVVDNGIGIMEKLHTTIFEPFTRTERGQKVSSGDGIGLAFVKELVELHQGTITVDSKINEGSCFTVSFPKHRQYLPEVTAASVVPETSAHKTELFKNENPETAESARISDPTATRSILLIDDNPDVLSVLAKAFENKYKVTEMSDARAAVELARKGGFDVVITDLMMPDYDGHQVLKDLKGDKRTRDIKIVIFSALTSESDMLKALDEGADAYMTKPIPLKVLVRQVERLFEQDNTESSISGSPAGNYNREEQKFLLECRKIINECMTDEDFGIGMLAQRLSMSHSALYKKIKSMTGMSIIDFINEYRIYKAVQLFKDGNTNVQAVAEMCGFHDVKTFRETFKRKMQMPPKQYMIKLQEK